MRRKTTVVVRRVRRASGVHVLVTEDGRIWWRRLVRISGIAAVGEAVGSSLGTVRAEVAAAAAEGRGEGMCVARNMW